ncbi:MAG: DUF2231 domain-containing protein [Beijerinckiaceae bacterium]
MRGFAERMEPGTPSYVAVARHPVHAMLVTFPIAFLISLLGSDLAYLSLRDDFWARVSLWLSGAGAVTGVLAGLSGTVEVLAIRQIRLRIAAWDHFVLAVMMLSVAIANWGFRVADPAGAIWPWGLYLSGLGFVLVAGAGWLGGALVFEHKVGTEEYEE